MTDYTSEDLEDHDAIGAVIKDSEGRILMQEHKKYGFWTIPIGKSAIGTAIEGLKKELQEECGIKVKEFKEITVRKFDYERRGKTVHLNGHLYKIISYEGIIENKEPHKHSRQEFMTLEAIKGLPFLSDMTLLYLETLGIIRSARLK